MELIRQLKHKGIVVIPQDIREQANLREGDSISFSIVDDNIIIKKHRKNDKKFLEMFFSVSRTKGKDITLEELKKLEDESYDLP
ncbi:MAG: AbrB/MazE/SpoVT family DNA-binding domain-containing protein [Nanoarchaeota archaeon]